MSWICDASGRVHQKVPDEILADAEAQAKAAMEESDMEDWAGGGRGPRGLGRRLR